MEDSLRLKDISENSSRRFSQSFPVFNRSMTPWRMLFLRSEIGIGREFARIELISARRGGGRRRPDVFLPVLRLADDAIPSHEALVVVKRYCPLPRTPFSSCRDDLAIVVAFPDPLRAWTRGGRVHERVSDALDACQQLVLQRFYPVLCILEVDYAVELILQERPEATMRNGREPTRKVSGCEDMTEDKKRQRKGREAHTGGGAGEKKSTEPDKRCRRCKKETNPMFDFAEGEGLRRSRRAHL
eukprot:768335-Hanusia_phi.AAC.8